MITNLTFEELNQYKHRFSLYNNYSFIRDIDDNIIINETVVNSIVENANKEEYSNVEIKIKEFNHLFIVKKLAWESNYFGLQSYSIEFVFFCHNDYLILRKAINSFIELYVPINSYFTVNVPSEDICLVQALSNTSFNLIETRLNYSLKLDQYFETIKKKDIGVAENKDIPKLRSVAKKMRNRFDRVHADPTFTHEVADEYLAIFAENSIKGFADIVLKVNDKEGVPFGFLAGNYPDSIAGVNVSKLVLAAIDSSIQKGRLDDLLREMIFSCKSKNANYLTTITQAANIPAIRTWEKAGFKLHKVTHLYSIYND